MGERGIVYSNCVTIDTSLNIHLIISQIICQEVETSSKRQLLVVEMR